MVALLNCVENNAIDGINRAVLVQAYQALDNLHEPAERKNRIRACLIQLNLHLLQDPNRVRANELQKLVNDVRDLTNAKNVLQQNANVLDRDIQDLRNKLNAQQQIIDTLSQQLYAEKSRLRQYDLEFVQRKIANLNSKTITEVGASVASGIPAGALAFVTFGASLALWGLAVKAAGDDADKNNKEVKYWEKVAGLITDKWLPLEDAQKQAVVA